MVRIGLPDLPNLEAGGQLCLVFTAKFTATACIHAKLKETLVILEDQESFSFTIFYA